MTETHSDSGSAQSGSGHRKTFDARRLSFMGGAKIRNPPAGKGDLDGDVRRVLDGETSVEEVIAEDVDESTKAMTGSPATKRL
jgi:hypothetical protein